MANNPTSNSALREFAETFGEPLLVAANTPMPIDNEEDIWFVEHGAIDVLSTQYEDGQMQAPFRHFVRLESHRMAFGADIRDHRVKLVFKAVQGTTVRRISRELLLNKLSQGEVSDDLVSEVYEQVNEWIKNVSSTVAREMDTRPAAEQLVAPGSAAASGVNSARQGVVWIVSDVLDASYLGLIDRLIEHDQSKMLAVTQDTWAYIYSTKGEACKSTSEFDLTAVITDILPEFLLVSLDALALHQQLLLVDDANLQKEQANLRQHQKTIARARLSTLTSDPDEYKIKQIPLEAALRMVGKHEGIEIRTPVKALRGENSSLNDYLEASTIRAREVNLTSESRWWQGDSGAMLGFRGENNAPVVLLPKTNGRYRVVDPISGESTHASEKTAAEIHRVYMLYPGLQTSDAVDFEQFVPASGARMSGDVVRLVAAGLGAGLIALTPAVVANILVGQVINHGDVGTLLQMGSVLIALALVAALLHVIRGTVMMRIEGRVTARLGAVLMDRLLRLRPEFYRRFNSGELAAKSLILQDVRDFLSAIAADSVLTTLFLLPAFGLMFFFDAAMAFTALFSGVIVLGVVTMFCILHIEPQRRYLESMFKIAGEVHQFLIGITKLRLAGAENSAFAAWADLYREHKRAEIQLSVLSEHLTAFSASVPAIISAIFFMVVMLKSENALAIEDFLAAYTAAMIFYMSIFLLAQSAKAISIVKPACEQLLPILSNPTNTGSDGGMQLTLQGEIHLDKVSFTYPGSELPVLQDVTIHAKPGEFIAIVGESGSGKSTILRLALGLETPLSGAVYYDGRDLSYLDLVMVCRQVGVVTQDGNLQNGTVLDNIIGVSTDLTTEDAWTAARQAAVEEDIRAMPLGLYTSVGENSSTFSGGQVQRIRIAAALARSPKIIFLDEATSWLDTKSQALTMKSISDSSKTRIVIAHRLSTIRMANRIYVLQGGCVVQVGNYEELLETTGFFRDMALRQMA